LDHQKKEVESKNTIVISESKELVERVISEEDDRIVVLRINRPEKANAYNYAILSCLENELVKAIEDENIRVILITGAGNRSFCSGADKNELVSRGAQEGLNLKGRNVFNFLAKSPKLTIALINGAAVGGGLELALACDFRFSVPGAVFALPEVSLGITPAAGGMRRLQPLIGKARAKEMIILGRQLNVKEAFDFGLVTYVGDDYFDYGINQAKKIVNTNQLALQLAKKNMDAENDSVLEELEKVTQALLYEMKIKKNELEK